MLDDDHLADILLDSDLIDREDLDRALDDKSASESLYRALVHGDLVDEGSLARLLADRLSVEFVDVDDLTPDDQILDLLPHELALDYETLPVELEQSDGHDGGATLVVAMSDPIDMMAMDEVATHTGIDIRPVLAGPRALREAIDRCYDAHASTPTRTSGGAVDESASTEDEPGGIEDVDPTARRPAPPPDSSQDDVNASVPGRPVAEISDNDQSDAVELPAVDESDDNDTTGDGDPHESADDETDEPLPERRERTRSELGRIAVEQVEVSRDDLDDDGNVRPDALQRRADSTSDAPSDDQSDDNADSDKPETLTDPERRERLENLVQRLDEKSDTLLEESAEDAAAPRSTEPPDASTSDAGDSSPLDSPSPQPQSTDQFGLLLAELSDDTMPPDVRDALASLEDDQVLKAAVAAMVDAGQIAPADILDHAPSADTPDDPEPHRGLDQVSSEAG